MILGALLVSIVLIITYRIYILKFSEYDFDTYGHLYFSKQLTKSRLGPFSTIPVNVIESKGFKYPFMFHWILVKTIGLNALIKFQHIVNTILELFFAFIWGFFLYYIGYSFEFILVVGCLYLSTPLLTNINASGPRLFSFTPRLFSEVLTASYFIIIFAPSELPSLVILIIATSLALLVISSVKFGLQALLLTGTLSGMFTFSFDPIVPLLISVVVLAISSKGDFLITLKRHLNHLAWYFRKYKLGVLQVGHRSSLSGLWVRKQSFVKNLYGIIFSRASIKGYLTGPIHMPYLIPVLIYFFSDPYDLNGLIVPTISGILVYSLINIPRFLFLGESERYLNHVAILICIVFVENIFDNQHWIVLGLIFSFQVLFGVFQMRVLKGKNKSSNELRGKINSDITDFLAQDTEMRKVICFPYHLGSYYSILLKTDHQLMGVLCTDFETHPIVMEKLELRYAYLDLKQLDYFNQRFGVDTLVIDRSALSKVGLNGWEPSSNWNSLKKFSPTVEILEYKD